MQQTLPMPQSRSGGAAQPGAATNRHSDTLPQHFIPSALQLLD
jgi:hypothetical protein